MPRSHSPESKELNLTTEMSAPQLLDQCKKFLSSHEQALLEAHRNGKSGRETAKARAKHMDELLKALWKHSSETLSKQSTPLSENTLSCIAVGGYGRGELCPYSDIDLLFFKNPKQKSDDIIANKFVEMILYVLWDLGLKVGHSTRALNDIVEKASEDPETFTAFLEARHITGSKDMFHQFQQAFHRRCVVTQTKSYLSWLTQNQTRRHSKNGGTAFLQEPHVKNGCGGMRDYHNLIWICLIKLGTDQTAKLEKENWLSHEEVKRIENAYNFLITIRTELHYEQKRGSDILTLQLQGRISKALGYSQKNVLLRTEEFMRDYFKAARDLYHLCNLTSRRIVEASDTSTHKKILSFIPSKLKFRQKIDGFFLEKKVLYAEQKNLFDEDPVQFLRAFRILQKHDTVFSPELENLILQKIDLVERKLLWINEAREMFLNMLRKKGKVGRILRLMHETGFLGKIIPEFEPLTCLVQHEFFHTYTADEHTLVCIEQLDRVLDSRDPQLKRYRELFVSCIQPEVLYLAILLHDVGKAANSKHHNEISAQLASRCARRLKLPINQLHTLVLWVDHHMTLHEFAQRRNLDDANTIHDFAKIVQTRDQLDGLMLMSYADSRGSSANQNWSSWKDLLVWTLYDQTVRMLQGEEEFTKQIHDEKMDILSRVRKQVGPEVSEGEFAIHFTLLPNRYALSVSDSLMAEHVKLVNQFLISQVVDGSDPLRPLIRWIDKPHEDHSEVIVVTWDRERLFSKIAGSFSLSGLNILSADVYTREDNVVIDTFRICTTRIDPTPNKVERREFEKILTQTLKDPLFDLHQELVSNRASKQTDNEDRIDFPSRIAFDNQTSPDCTLLHLETPDYMGLLHDVTDCLANHKISIQYSRITTEKGAALDTFYLTDPDNNKLEDKEKLNQLLVELKQILIAQTHP